MKKNILIIFCCAIILSVSTFAYSAEGLYGSGNLGLAMPNNSDVTDSTSPGVSIKFKSDTGLALGAAVGYDFGNNIRVEGEISYQKNDLNKASFAGVDAALTGDTSNLGLLLNGYYDFANTSRFTPFISAGLGFDKVKLNDFYIPGSGEPSYSDDDTVFAYQVGVGIGYAVNKKVSIDVKYRYLGTSDPKFDTATVEYSSHNFYVGIRFPF
jgi:opacity protein-like surface antigen